MAFFNCCKRKLLLGLLIAFFSGHGQAILLSQEKVREIGEKVFDLFDENIEEFHFRHRNDLYVGETPYHLHLDVETIWNSPLTIAQTFPHGGVYISGEWFRKGLVDYYGAVFIFCHELGHHFGGAPFSKNLDEQDLLSIEGQADYFAAHVCVKKFYNESLDFREYVKRNYVPRDAFTKECEKGGDGEDLLVDDCSVLVEATFSLFEMFSALRGYEKLTDDFGKLLPMYEESEEHYAYHPTPQCRFQTSVDAFLCPKSTEEFVFSSDQTNEVYCDEKFGDVMGLRNSCWYNSKEGDLPHEGR